MTFKSELTVIICTYNRCDLLDFCLDSLTRQTKKSFTVLVVNNNSTDATSEVVERYSGKLKVTELIEKSQGLSYARNRGFKEAKADWVAYLDDDATAREDWVEQIIQTAQSSSFEAFGGIYLPWYKDGRVHWYMDDYGSNKKFFPTKGTYELSGIQFISGGNAAYQRSALLNSSGFPTDIGMKGKDLGYGEEIALQLELKNAGCRLGVNTEMIIDHLVPMRKQQVSFFLDSYKKKGSVYWCGRKKSIFRLLLFLLQGVLSVSFIGIKVLLRLFRTDYYRENAQIDFMTKFYLYFYAAKNYHRHS